MKKYSQKEAEIRNLLLSGLSSQQSKEEEFSGGKKKNWDKLMYSCTSNKDVESAIDLMYRLNEVSGWSGYKSYNPEIPILIAPKFISGFKEEYFSSVANLVADIANPLKNVTFTHRPHWTNAHFKELYEFEATTSFEEDERILVKGAHYIADKIISSKTGLKLAIVSGPISTGGAGNAKENLRFFHQSIIKLGNCGYDMFNQMPFGFIFNRVHLIQKVKGFSGYHGQVIMDNFYRLILESRIIKTLVQLPGWETSIGAVQEYEISQKCGIRIISLEEALQVKELSSVA